MGESGVTGATLFSGIGAPELAAPWIDWRWAAETDRFASAVHAFRHQIPNLGDVTADDFTNRAEPTDILVAGSPCQDFSIAGKRAGMAGSRGNLAIRFLDIVAALRSRWLLFENVPGLLSSHKGADFGALLYRLAELGYSFAWTVLDAQYFGLAQRRERVLLVGYFGVRTAPAAVLFDLESLSGNVAPRRTPGKDVAGTLGGGTGQRGWCDDLDRATFVARALNAKGGSGRIDAESETFIAHTLRGEGFDASEDGTGRGTPIVAFSCKDHGSDAGEIAPTLRAMEFRNSHANAGGQVAVAFNLRGREGGAMPEITEKASLRAASGGSSRSYIAHWGVRRLTPRECERLQGFPDDFTLIPTYRKRQREKGADSEALYAYYRRTSDGRHHVRKRDGRVYATPDGPRYRALGNSMPVPVIAWILERIRRVDELLRNDGGDR